MESNLSAFSKEFLDLVKDNAAMNQRTVEQQLTDDVIEYIKEEGFAISPELITISNQEVCKPTAPEFYKINAFDYSEEAGILDLLITNYIESESIPELTKSKIQLFQNQIIRFLSFSLTSNSFLAKLKEEQPEAAEIVETIITEFKNKHVNLVRFFIISNGLKKIDVVLDQEITLGAFTFDCEFQIWDIETIRRSDLASRAEGAIDIDFPNLYDHPIDCLELEETNGVKSYLAIMPAVILAKVFGEYKARLLNQNVRNYLGGKIKVNRGMADTLRNSPGLFFAYNNGISSTANEVKIIRDEETGKCTITNIRNWQIVNGGQTTNTIYSIYTKDKDLLSKAFVTMKLSEIRQADDIERARTISNIGRFANSQTQIKESDLSANIDYMVKLQEFSRTEWVPASSVRRGTQWFFERMRGQYEMEAGDKKTKKYK
jgi:predicted transport protein